ncbi:hypothetical protein BDV26DRAFT_302779 [Aspergillus bertholletiae]|uniref:AAA+ ATPase domain-containing protein n=1 Tax=Aspergillus bertholletiae TaxID=1226010 RepID=A0A5N7ANY9_9EURO|nr:hypothetical protein BDV26DRAFT_302779 [Aspergillus bertholletiae]
MATEEYIESLEKRIRLLECLVLDKNQEDERSSASSVTEEEKNGGGLDAQTEGYTSDEGDNGYRPSMLPIELRVAKLSSIPFIFHPLPADSLPLIEAVQFPGGRKVAEQEIKEFSISLRDVRPEKAIEMIRETCNKPWKPDTPIAAVRIMSKPLASALVSTFDADHELQHMILYRPFIEATYFFEVAKKRVAEMEAHAGQDLRSVTAGSMDSVTKSSQVANGQDLLAQLRFYVRFMEENIMPFPLQLKSLSAVDEASVEFDDLYHLFQLGDIIVYPEATRNYEELIGSKLADRGLWRVYSKVWRSMSDEFVVKAYCIDYDGDSYVCTKESFTIERYEGPVSIASLKIFPIRFSNKMKELCDNAKRQGEAFQLFTKAKLVSHDGWASEPNTADPVLRHITGDMVIDFAEAFKAHPDCRPVSNAPNVQKSECKPETNFPDAVVWRWVDGETMSERADGYSWMTGWHVRWLQKSHYCCNEDPFLSHLIKGGQGRYALRDEDLYLLPQRLFAYSLQDRQFVAVHVDNLSLIEYRGSKFDNLVISPTHVTMLQALVESHLIRNEAYNSTGVQMATQDVVQNKGRGLVILLHGVPGVGKTSTAEAIANEFKKPLLPITCRDSELDPATMEQSLKDTFRLAQVWDCIVLLDEADIFLAERVPSDLNRNAIVSVFLRILDYYSGILFLTTNRVGIIDEAFKSRIHVSLYYPHLKRHQTERIWQLNLQRLAEIEEEQTKITNKPVLSVDHDGIMDFAKEHYQKCKESGQGLWNGRQIRNAFIIASALARYEKSRKPHISKSYDLNASHLKAAAETGFGFDRYLHPAKATSDGEAAFVQGPRADYIRSFQAKTDCVNSSSSQDITRTLPYRPVAPVMNSVNGAVHPSQTDPSRIYDDGYPDASQSHLSPFASPHHNILRSQPQYMVDSRTGLDKVG